MALLWGRVSPEFVGLKTENQINTGLVFKPQLTICVQQALHLPGKSEISTGNDIIPELITIQYKSAKLL